MFTNILTRIFFLGLIGISFNLSAQIDTIYFVSGEFLIGEVQKMEKNILEVETTYSDEDFKIEWDEVTRIRTQSQFMIALSNGWKYHGRLYSVSDSAIQILTMPITPLIVPKEDIVYLDPYNDKFKDRFSASIDLGYDLAKANSLRAFTSRLGLGYHTDNWSTNGSFHILRSTQEKTEDIQRIETDANFRYILPKLWYIIGTVSGLSNTEQKLELRRNIQAGVGKFLVQTNSMYWGAKVGLNLNNEQYSNDTEDRQSWEGYFGTELNLYNVGDVDLYFQIIAYPGITAPDRWRTDAKIDLKYDLPLDFYIKLGLSFNYDNRPADDASEMDYLFQTGIGWEW
jgi:putative salt-induced outer membrane protein YdiY